MNRYVEKAKTQTMQAYSEWKRAAGPGENIPGRKKGRLRKTDADVLLRIFAKHMLMAMAEQAKEDGHSIAWVEISLQDMEGENFDACQSN